MVVNAKRDLESRLDGVDEHLNLLEDRTLADFAAIGKLFGYNLAYAPVASACSCFSSKYTAATVTTTAAAQTTVTVAVAKATATVTTTVKGFTVYVLSSHHPRSPVCPSFLHASLETIDVVLTLYLPSAL